MPLVKLEKIKKRVNMDPWSSSIHMAFTKLSSMISVLVQYFTGLHGLLKKEITQCCHEYYKRNTSDAELDTADFGADVDLDANVDIKILALWKRSYPVDRFLAGAIIMSRGCMRENST